MVFVCDGLDVPVLVGAVVLEVTARGDGNRPSEACGRHGARGPHNVIITDDMSAVIYGRQDQSGRTCSAGTPTLAPGARRGQVMVAVRSWILQQPKKTNR